MASCELMFNPFSQSVGDNQDAQIGYIVTGTTDINEATNTVSSYAPFRLGPLYLHEIKVTPVSPDTWNAYAVYNSNVPDSQATYSVEIGTSSTHITQSLQTVNSYGIEGKQIPDYQGAIGVTKDGIEGVDIQTPTFTWNERHLIPSSQMGRSYVQTVLACTGMMNDASFRIFDPGEALFLGCTLVQSQSLPGWEGNFRWIGSMNATNFNVGEITITEKYGHDYMWIKYNEQSNGGSTIRIPYFVFIERVYQFGSMDQMQLPDPT